MAFLSMSGQMICRHCGQGKAVDQLLRQKCWGVTVVRLYSANVTTDNVKVSLDEQSGIGELRFNKAPGNFLTRELMLSLSSILEKFENHAQCRGLVLSSAVPKMFCAGLDIKDLYRPNADNLIEVRRLMQSTWLQLYSSRLVTAAAITGHSLGGGCLVTMACDHRVMATGNYTIGTRTSFLGILPPVWVVDTMTNVLGHRQAERALQLGQLFSAEEALKLGLVDELASEDEVVERARQEVSRWLKVPDEARQLTKAAMRQSLIDRARTDEDRDVKDFVAFVMKDSSQKSIGDFLHAMKNKKKMT